MSLGWDTIDMTKRRKGYLPLGQVAGPGVTASLGRHRWERQASQAPPQVGRLYPAECLDCGRPPIHGAGTARPPLGLEGGRPPCRLEGDMDRSSGQSAPCDACGVRHSSVGHHQIFGHDPSPAMKVTAFLCGCLFLSNPLSDSGFGWGWWGGTKFEITWNRGHSGQVQ